MGPGNKGFMQRWDGARPADPNSPQATGYSTDVYGTLALEALRAHDPGEGRPFFLYLPWQAVHAPYDKPPWCNNSLLCTYLRTYVRTYVRSHLLCVHYYVRMYVRMLHVLHV